MKTNCPVGHSPTQAELDAFRLKTVLPGKSLILKSAIPVYDGDRLIGYGERADVEKSGTLHNFDEVERLTGDKSIFDSIDMFAEASAVERRTVQKEAELEAANQVTPAGPNTVLDATFPPSLMGRVSVQKTAYDEDDAQDGGILGDTFPTHV